MDYLSTPHILLIFLYFKGAASIFHFDTAPITSYALLIFINRGIPHFHFYTGPLNQGIKWNG